MKRTIAVLLAILAVAGVAAQELTVSGEFKTGFYTEQEQIGNNDSVARSMMKNADGDSGQGEGRARLNLQFSYQNIGFRVRFQQEAFGQSSPKWGFAYAYGNLFNDQLKISAGLLGESPWGTGGPELRKELEGDPNSDIGLMGLRFEYKPFFAPGLNIGLALSQPDQNISKDPLKQTFGELVQESVLGVSYEHEYFAARFGYRLDSEMDTYIASRKNEGARLAYRLEEKILGTMLEGMQVWLNGYYYGIGAEKNQPSYFQNWLYCQYDTENFIAHFDVYFSANQEYNNSAFTPAARKAYSSLELWPYFYWKFLDNRLQAGSRFGFGLEFGDGKVYKDSPYQFFTIEPQVRILMNTNTYIAFVYNFTNSYALPGTDVKAGDISQKHFINLRAVYTF
jgi:hypothetical protein